jgi:hypothetical protein
MLMSISGGLVPNPVNALHDQDLLAILVKLAQADDVHHQLGDEVDAGQYLVLTALAPEEDRAAPLDVDPSAIPELARPTDVVVDHGQGRALPRHVIRRAGVEDPARATATALLPELDK